MLDGSVRQRHGYEEVYSWDIPDGFVLGHMPDGSVRQRHGYEEVYSWDIPDGFVLGHP